MEGHSTSVIVLGHSFVRRLKTSAHVYLFESMEAKVNFVFKSGAMIDDYFDLGYIDELILNNTDLLYLEIGSNDLCQLHIPVKTLLVKLRECVARFTSRGVHVVLGEVLRRNAKLNSPTSTGQERYLAQYNERVKEFNDGVAEFVISAPRVSIWYHFELNQSLPFRDGIHPSGSGLGLYAKSVRAAIENAINV